MSRENFSDKSKIGQEFPPDSYVELKPSLPKTVEEELFPQFVPGSKYKVDHQNKYTVWVYKFGEENSLPIAKRYLRRVLS